MMNEEPVDHRIRRDRDRDAGHLFGNGALPQLLTNRLPRTLNATLPRPYADFGRAAARRDRPRRGKAGPNAAARTRHENVGINGHL